MKPLSAELPEGYFRDCPNIRAVPEDENLYCLARSLQAQGFLAPVGAVDFTQFGEQFGELMWGFRRLAAYRLGRRENFNLPETIPTLLYPASLSLEEREIYTITENFQRQELTEVEQFQAVAALSQRGLTLEQIGDKINKSKSTVCKYRAPDSGPEEARAHFLAGRLSLGDCYRISTASDPLATMNALLGKRGGKGGQKPEPHCGTTQDAGPTRITIPLPLAGKDKPSLGVVTITTKGQGINQEMAETLLRAAIRSVKDGKGLNFKPTQSGFRDEASSQALAETAS